jgi:hypothetical protein
MGEARRRWMEGSVYICQSGWRFRVPNVSMVGKREKREKRCPVNLG